MATETKLIISIFFLSALMLVIACILHGPWFPVSRKRKENIKLKGLYHFTSAEALVKIMDEGLKGYPADMKGLESFLGNMVWTYCAADKRGIEGLHDTLLQKHRSKLNSDRVQVCIKLTGFTDEDLKRFRYRIGFGGDEAIVYLGDYLKPEKIEVIKKWN